jgi:hypothetical protein
MGEEGKEDIFLREDPVALGRSGSTKQREAAWRLRGRATRQVKEKLLAKMRVPSGSLPRPFNSTRHA